MTEILLHLMPYSDLPIPLILTKISSFNTKTLWTQPRFYSVLWKWPVRGFTVHLFYMDTSSIKIPQDFKGFECIFEVSSVLIAKFSSCFVSGKETWTKIQV